VRLHIGNIAIFSDADIVAVRLRVASAIARAGVAVTARACGDRGARRASFLPEQFR